MIIGSCTLIKKIAMGGCAEIFLAKAPNRRGQEKYLVCKCLNKSLSDDNTFLRSIIQEVQLSVQLRHPNILEVFDLQIQGDQVFLTMEYMDAQDLQKLQAGCKQRGEKIPIPMALYVIRQAAAGLHAAHELTDSKGNPLQLVHRDISPENILFGSDGDIKLSDFGIAKTANMPDITPSDIIQGKFNYMSPEQAWGDKLDRRSDLFSLGVVLYESLLGQSMYPTGSIDTTIACARVARFDLPHEVDPAFPEDLEKILLKALDIDKNQRFATVLEFSTALGEFVEKHHFGVTREEWVSWLQSRVSFPSPRLPLMHYSEIPSSKHSILSLPAVQPVSSDAEITGQVPVDELREMVRKTAERSLQLLPAVQPAQQPSKSSSELNIVTDPQPETNHLSGLDRVSVKTIVLVFAILAAMLVTAIVCVLIFA